MSWPPQLPALKEHLRSRGEPGDVLNEDDVQLQVVLDAVVAFVQRVHRGRYNFDGDLGSTRPDPDAGIELGTVMLAARWHTRKRSPDGMIDMGELGSSRVPSFDADIEKLLRIGRQSIPVVG